MNYLNCCFRKEWNRFGILFIKMFLMLLKKSFLGFLVFMYFDWNVEYVVQVDVVMKGLGVVLL